MPEMYYYKFVTCNLKYQGEDRLATEKRSHASIVVGLQKCRLNETRPFSPGVFDRVKSYHVDLPQKPWAAGTLLTYLRGQCSTVGTCLFCTGITITNLVALGHTVKGSRKFGSTGPALPPLCLDMADT